MESSLDKATRISARDTRDKIDSFTSMLSGGGCSNAADAQSDKPGDAKPQSSGVEDDGARAGRGGSTSSTNSGSTDDEPAACGSEQATDGSSGGGGTTSTFSEQLLDKAVDVVRENVLGQCKVDDGPNVDHARDEQIGDFIRAQYKSNSGNS